MIRRPPRSTLSLHDALPILGKKIRELLLPHREQFVNGCVEHGYTRKLARSEEHTSELQSHSDLVCRLLLEKKKKKQYIMQIEKKEPHTYVNKSQDTHNHSVL